MAEWRTTQARLVDGIKRRALADLHETREGEALVLAIYLWVEEGAEVAAFEAAREEALPAELLQQLERHSKDEQRHAEMFRRELRRLGVQVPDLSSSPLGQWKQRRLMALADEAAPRFSQGRAVVLFAVGDRMERMGLRVLERHASVLEELDAAGSGSSRTLAILRSVITDERRHVAECAGALDRLVLPEERTELETLLERIEAIERSFAVSGAVALWAAAQGLRVAQGARSFAGRFTREQWS